MRIYDFSDGFTSSAAPTSQGYAAPRQGVTTLTADNQAVTVGSASYLPLSSDNGTATNRTFTLGDGAVAGQELILEWTHATNQGELASAGNAKLSATWSPGQYDTLTLRWNGTVWLETARANN